MGPTVRAEREKTPPDDRHVWLLHLLDWECGGKRSANGSDLSVLRRCLRVLSSRRRSCSLFRHVRQSHPWSRSHGLLNDRVYGASPRTLYRRLYCHEPTFGLALDRVHRCFDGLPRPGAQCLVPRRNVSTDCTGRESQRTTPPHVELGDPCQARRNRSRLSRTHHQEFQSTAAAACDGAHRLTSQCLHGLHLRPALSVSHRLSHRLPADPPHEPGRWRVALLRYGLRHDTGRPIHRLHSEILREKVGREQQRHDPRVASPARNRRRRFLHLGRLLVRLVRLQGRHPLDRTHAVRPPHRLRLTLHLPPISQLPRGLLPHVVSPPLNPAPFFVPIQTPPPRFFFSPLTKTNPLFSHSAASAIAANTFLRSLFGAIFPLFATYMFDAMGVNWASTLLGAVALVLVPIPVVFWRYGAKIRTRSKFAPTAKAQPAPVVVEEEDRMERGDGEK